MITYIKFLLKEFLGFENNDESLLIESELENNNEKTKWLNLCYVIGILSLLGISIYLYSNGWFTINSNINKIGHLRDIDEIGDLLYKISAELSKFSTVRSWEIIHKVLKELEKDTFNSLELINELENLKKINILFPGQFSTNQDSFEKSLIKLINFLKEIL